MKQKNKKIQKIVISFFILLVGIGIGFWVAKKEYYSKNTSSVVAVAQPIVAIPATPALQSQAKIETVDDFVGDFKVARVVDGDTIEIEGGEKVRYIGMDAPETVDPVKPVECFGKEASDENKLLVEGKTVRLEKDTSERDKYGRLLRYVWVGNDFVNLELVQQGFARVETIAPDEKYEEQIVQAQNQAKSSKLGLWSSCVK